MLIDDVAKKKMLASWSREVQLYVMEPTPGIFRCRCGSDVLVTAGRDDRVRCLKCKELHYIEL